MHIPMKQLLMTGLIGLAIFGCSSEKEKPVQTEEPTYTLIFIDKSVSVNVNQAFVNQKYTQEISNLIEANLHTKGDKVEVYFIHDNTSKARALSQSVRSEMDDVSNASPTDREAARAAFDLSLQREKTMIRQRVLQQLTRQNGSLSNQRTDIWASLPVIAKANESGMPVKVYYLSDMLESMKGSGRRDLHESPPRDDAQAEEWAKADAGKLKQYTIGSPEITMVLPFEPNASAKINNPTVTHYWQTLFNELGVSSIEEQ